MQDVWLGNGAVLYSGKGTKLITGYKLFPNFGPMIDRRWPKWAGNYFFLLRETSAKKRETGAKFRKKAQEQKVYHLYPVHGSIRAYFSKCIAPTPEVDENIFAQCCS